MANITPQQWAEKHDVPLRTVRNWMTLGKVATVKEKRTIIVARKRWVQVIPEDAEPPKF